MKIWVLTNEYEPNIIGGLGIAATKLTRALAERDLTIHVLTKGTDPKVKSTNRSGVKLIRFPRTSAYFSSKQQLFHPHSILTWTTQNQLTTPDLIHIHSVQFTELAETLQKHHNTPIVYTCHSLVASEGTAAQKSTAAKRQTKLLRLADRIVVPSFWQKQQLLDFYPFCADKVIVSPHGVEVKPTIRKAPRHRLFFAGRIVRSKGIEELLHAVAALAKQYPDIRLDVAGTGSKMYLRKLHALCDSLKIRSNVKWLGFQSHEKLLKMYGSYSAVVMPSKQESFGLVAMEALATGVPLVSTQAGGLAEFVDRGVAEVISKPTANEITRAIQQMWNNSKETKERVKKGLERAYKYRWSHIAAHYQIIFEQCKKAESDGNW